MEKQKLTISWDDLNARRVDNRLREQAAMERNRSYAQMRDDALPEASTTQQQSVWNNAVFCLAIFGLIGGFLAWGMQTLVEGPLKPAIGAMLNYDPNARADSESRLSSLREIELGLQLKQIKPAEAKDAIEAVKADGRHNPWFSIAINDQLKPEQRKARIAELDSTDRAALFMIHLISYGLCGMMMAMCLAVAEPLTQRKKVAAWINMGMGAAVGIIGAVAATLLAGRITSFTESLTRDQNTTIQQILVKAAIWGTLGLFLGLGSGLVMRNLKKLGAGAAGGLLGGLIGGALVTPVATISYNIHVAHLVALLTIGGAAGYITGLLENIVKAGWLKVTSGIIAGKQFILYRNPTYIGSSPDCQIYLFKDSAVGKRHAAIHLIPGGIEIEDLPLGGPTVVNNKPVSRVKLRNGDTIQIGATSFCFQEKRPSAGK